MLDTVVMQTRLSSANTVFNEGCFFLAAIANGPLVFPDEKDMPREQERILWYTRDESFAVFSLPATQSLPS